MRVSKMLAAMLSIGLLLSWGCASAPYTGRRQLIALSESNEIKMGLTAAQQTLAKSNIERGTPRAARVEKIGWKIAGVSGKPEFNWQFYTVASEEINAFCVPGGVVVFNTGLLDLLGDNDAEVAFVMGHEIGHALARHGAERYSQQVLTNVGVSAVAGVAGSAGAGLLAGGLAKYGVLLPYSRLHESEADHIGLMLMAKAGYDPRAGVSAHEKMLKAKGGDTAFGFLSTHPLTAERIENLRKIMPEALSYYASEQSAEDAAKKRSGPKSQEAARAF